MRDLRKLAVAVVLAAVFAAGWLWRAAGDGVEQRTFLPAGQFAGVDGVKYRLATLRISRQVASGYSDQITPAPGAVLVLARLDYDASTHSGNLYCSFELVAGELAWDQLFGFAPTEPDSTSCTAGSAGTVSALFEVPEKFLDQIQGVEVVPPGGVAAPVLIGQPQ